MSEDDVATFPTKWECSCHPEYVKLPVVVSERHALEMLEEEDPPGCLGVGGLQEPPKNSPIKPPHAWICFCKQRELHMKGNREKKVIVYLDIDEYINMLKEFPSHWLCRCHQEICTKLPVVVDYTDAVEKMIASLHLPIPIAFGAARGPPAQMMFHKGVFPPPQMLYCSCMAKTYGFNEQLLVYFDSETFCSKNNLCHKIVVDGTEASGFSDINDQKDSTIQKTPPPAGTSSTKTNKSVIWNTSLESVKYISDDDCDDGYEKIFSDESEEDEQIVDVSQRPTTIDSANSHRINDEAQNGYNDIMEQSSVVPEFETENARSEPLFAVNEEPLFEYDDSPYYSPYLLRILKKRNENAMANVRGVSSMDFCSSLKRNVYDEAIMPNDVKDERSAQLLSPQIHEEPLFEYDDSPYYSSRGRYYSMNSMVKEETVYSEGNDASHNANVTETMNPFSVDVSGNEDRQFNRMKSISCVGGKEEPSLYSRNSTDNDSQEATRLPRIISEDQGAREADDEEKKAEAVPQIETEDNENEQPLDLNVKEEPLSEAVDDKCCEESEAIIQMETEGDRPLFNLKMEDEQLFEVGFGCDPLYDSHSDVNWREPLFEDDGAQCPSQEDLNDWTTGYNVSIRSINDSVTAHKITEEDNFRDFPCKRRRIRRRSNSSADEVDEKTSEYYDERGLYVERTHISQKITDPAILERIAKKREMRRMVKDHIHQQDALDDISSSDLPNYKKGFTFNDESTEILRRKLEEQSKLVSDKLAENPVDGSCSAGHHLFSDHEALLRSMHSSSISGANLSSYNLTSVTQVEMAAKHDFVPWSALVGLPYRGYIAHKMASEADPMAMKLNKMSKADEKSKKQNPWNAVKDLVLRKKTEMMSRLGQSEFTRKTPMQSVVNEPVEHSTKPKE